MAKARTTNLRKLKASFDAEHAKGMRALKTHDFRGVNRAIERERELIEEQKRHISEQRSKYAKTKKA
jgi:hypothetical protein